MSDKASSNSILDDAWDGAVGGLDWLKSVIYGEFADNRSLSAMIADMLLSFVPGVVIVTSARDAVAVIVRLAQHPEKRDDALEWIMLAACMIVIALPLAMAAGGAVAAGVGGIVGGIAGSELGAALRAVMLLLIKEATKLGDVLRFLQKFVKGDLLFFLRSIKFAKYEKALILAFDKTIGKLLDICKALRLKLEHVKYFDDAKAAIATLIEWERKFYAVQQSAIKQLPKAVAELDARLAKLLAQMAPKESHAVVTAVKAEKPAVKAVATQRVRDVAGQPLLLEMRPQPKMKQLPGPKIEREVVAGSKAPAAAPKAAAKAPATTAKADAAGAKAADSAAPVASKTGAADDAAKADADALKAKADPLDKVDDGVNAKRQDTVDIDAVVAGNRGLTAPPEEFGVAFFGFDNVNYYTRANGTLGRPGGSYFLMPLEDAGVVKNAHDAARYTGMAPSAQKAYLADANIYGISFPLDGLAVTRPTAADANGWAHFLEGGNTAVKLGDGPNAGYLLNTTREFVIPGGTPIPSGSTLFQLGQNGEWIPLIKF
jgi:hypothetical protein